VVLGDAERPADHRLVGATVCLCDLFDRARGNASLALCDIKRVRLDAGRVVVEARRGVLDELRIGKAGVDDVTGDRVGQRDVAADVDPQPQVRPLGRARAARVDRDEPGPIPDASQQVMKKDRMGLACIRAPEQDEVGLLSLSI